MRWFSLYAVLCLVGLVNACGSDESSPDGAGGKDAGGASGESGSGGMAGASGEGAMSGGGGEGGSGGTLNTGGGDIDASAGRDAATDASIDSGRDAAIEANTDGDGPTDGGIESSTRDAPSADSDAGGAVDHAAPIQDATSGLWMCGSHVCACNDSVDNDNDQVVDSLDPNCAAGAYTDSELGSIAGGECGTTQCSNCLDDDGDGTIDSGDIECTGGVDNDEATFGRGTSGAVTDSCPQDCFFDGNTGSGDDSCTWDLRCDPDNPGQYAEPACPYNPAYNNCPNSQTQQCIDACRPPTPNGCDCFGCCTVFDDEGLPHTVKLADTCTVDVLGDPSLCPRCTQTDSCINTCETCEHCLGKSPTDPSCVAQCEGGETPCTPGDAAGCPAGYYCVTGCCVAQP